MYVRWRSGCLAREGAAFLAPLNLTQYRDVFKSLGYDDPAEFAKFNHGASNR